jgi:hypothetical protein
MSDEEDDQKDRHYEDDDNDYYRNGYKTHYSRENSRSGQVIVKQLCSFDPTSRSSTFRLPHDCYMIFVGRLTSRKYLDELTQTAHHKRSSYGDETSDSSFTMMETEEIEYFLEYVTLNDKGAVEELADERKHHFVYEDHFNPALFEMVERNATYQNLKKVCRQYETRKGKNVDKIMDEHEKRTLLSAPKFTEKGLAFDDALAAALALSFYTGTASETVSRGASLVARQANGEVIEDGTKDEMNEAAIILFYLVKALSYIPYYWGYVMRSCRLTDDELKLYMPGCLITWIQFSSSKKGNTVATTFDFANRNTFFKIYSLTGRPIKEFSNFPDEDEVLFLPHSTFFVFKHDTTSDGQHHTIYMRQMELGLSEWSILWVDDNIFVEDWENKYHMESAASRALNMNVHFIPKSSTESALSFLRSPFGQRLKNKDQFRIVTDMRRDNENPSHNAGARLIKQVRRLGFENHCLVYVSMQAKAEQILNSELNPMELRFVQVTTHMEDLRKFINFDKYSPDYSSDRNASGSYPMYVPDNDENYF